MDHYPAADRVCRCDDVSDLESIRIVRLMISNKKPPLAQHSDCKRWFLVFRRYYSTFAGVCVASGVVPGGVSVGVSVVAGWLNWPNSDWRSARRCGAACHLTAPTRPFPVRIRPMALIAVPQSMPWLKAAMAITIIARPERTSGPYVVAMSLWVVGEFCIIAPPGLSGQHSLKQ